jgi:hypothetical protein
MADIRVTSVIETYQRRLSSGPYVPSTTFRRAKLDANGIANKLFLVFLFGNPEVGVQFLQEIKLIQSSIFTDKASDLDLYHGLMKNS